MSAKSVCTVCCIYSLTHLKTKDMCKHAVKKLPFLIKCVSHRYKTQQMCDKVILVNGGMLIFVPDCCKDHKMTDNLLVIVHALESVPDCIIKYNNKSPYNKAVCIYPSAIQFVLERFKTQEMCDKAIDIFSFIINSVTDRSINQSFVIYLFLKILLS